MTFDQPQLTFHTYRAMDFPSLTLEERFWVRVERTKAGCWLWRGQVNPQGYGQWSSGRKLFGTQAAHRVAYRLSVGEIPDGLVLDHLCRNTLCVNPDHLEAVTQHENLRRSTNWAGQNMAKTHCKRGHPLSGTNLQRTAHGERQCRECRLLRSRAAWHRNRPDGPVKCPDCAGSFRDQRALTVHRYRMHTAEGAGHTRPHQKEGARR